MKLAEAVEPWVIKKIFWKACSPLFRILLRMHGIRSKKTRVFGYPRISNDGRISFQDNVELHSSNAFYLSSGFVPNCLLKTYKKGEIIIGKNVQLNGTTIISARKVQIGDDTLIGNNCLISDTDIHPQNPSLRREVVSESTRTRPVTIGKNVWLGINVIVLKGVSIGNNSIIGAGSVVTGDVEPNSIYAGNPARLVKRLEEKVAVKRSR